MKETKENLAKIHFDKWSKSIIKNDFVKETLSIHFGYYTKYTKTLKDAIFNMNEYIAELLKLENKKNIKILDAGCGIGGTIIYLAKKYPNVSFIGITNSPNQINIGKLFAKKHNVTNVKFMCGNYENTEFPEKTFDGVFALESACYSQDYRAFLNEMNRILKKTGRLVIIDVFRRPGSLNFITKKIYQRFCNNFDYMNITTISEYEESLKLKGFYDTYIKDMSKNVRFSIFYYNVRTAVRFWVKIAKFFSHLKNNNKDFLNYAFKNNTFSWLCIFDIFRITGYYGISTVKN